MKIRPIALAICVCVLSVLSVRAATLIVTTTADSGPGSLRDTIAAASNGDTIQFDAALNGQTITLTSAELLISTDLTINGPGAGQLSVKRSTTAAGFRIFEIMPGLTVTIQGLTISNGIAAGAAIGEPGGAIYNNGSTLTIANSAISGNRAGFGGGISSVAQTGNTQLTISNSSVSGNSADITSSGNGVGGGIYNYGGGAFVAAVVLNDSTISGNGAQALGGGIRNEGSNSFLIINNSTISSNSVSLEGGGISNFGMLTVSNSTISGNQASFGGGIYGSGAVTNSTISGNTATGGDFGKGGGIYGRGTITNSTISGNVAGQGGGIYASGALEIGNTVLKAGASGANIFNNGGTVTSHGYNLSSDNGGGFLTATGDQINTDPMLGPLQDNGGPTFTHELLIGSPATNAGDPAFTPPPDFDQRGSGFPRVINGRIDIGSFELQTIAPTPTPTATATMAPSPIPSCPPVISQSSSQAITTGNSVSCNNGTGHTDNSYWRAFGVGTSFGGSYIITSVSFGVESANNTQPVTVRLYRNTGGAFPGGTRTLIGTATISVTAAQTGTVVTTPLSAGLPAGLSELVMELFTPDGQAAGNLFFVGSNASPESGPSYLSATACGITTPTTTAALGFPNMHIVFNVQGFCEGTPPPPSPTATATTTVTPTATATVTATATATAAGTPTPTPTPSVSPSATPTPSAAQPLNLSTRMRVLTDANVGIGGFIITGNVPKQVILRAIGPSLAGSGVPDPLADPVMELHGPPGFMTIISDDARDRGCTFGPVSHPSSSSDTLSLSSSLPRLKGEPMCLIGGPSNDLEPCICATLDPGAYTAIVRGKNNTSGVALVEVYDLSQAAASKLGNISTRAFVNTGANVMIAGFILGNGAGNDNLIVRGIGPSLTQFGVPNALANPTLELRDRNGVLIRANDDWMDDPTQKALIMAAGLAPTNDLESAIAATLAPGQYTALLAGLNNGIGVGLVEVYDRGAP